MITRETDYAIRTVLYLSQTGKDYISTAEIAENMDIPYRFARKVVRNLTEGHLVESTRGKTGGVRLIPAPNEISLLQVIQTLDPKNILLNSCCSDDCDDKKCERAGICTVHEKLLDLQSMVDCGLGKITFDQLLNK